MGDTGFLRLSILDSGSDTSWIPPGFRKRHSWGRLQGFQLPWISKFLSEIFFYCLNWMIFGIHGWNLNIPFQA
jgi:hypothetical protein